MRVRVLQAVPAEGLQFGAVRARAHGGLGRQVDQVRARGGLRDARRPRVAVAVGVDHRGVRVFGAQAGVVREDDPGVHLQPGRGERRRGFAVGVPRGPASGGVRAQAAARPALARRVEDGRVLRRDDAVPGVAGGQGAGGVVGGGEGDLSGAERGDPRGGLRVAGHVPGVDERGRLHSVSSSRACPRSMSRASCLTWSSSGSCSGGRTSPTSRPRSRTPALTSETA